MAASLTAKQLHRLLDYDPKTGRFTWRVTGKGKGKRRGAIAGTIMKTGYRSISIDGKRYYAGRLAFLWMTDRWPKKLINRVNGIFDDDRWTNLREATFSQAAATQRPWKKKHVPLKGASRDKNRYRASIKVNYRFIHLGNFRRREEAHAAYAAAARKYFGEFARTS